MRTLILSIATLVASFLVTLNLYERDNESKRKTVAQFKSEKSNCFVFSNKNREVEHKTFLGFYVL
jgi:hypothetical protein